MFTDHLCSLFNELPAWRAGLLTCHHTSESSRRPKMRLWGPYPPGVSDSAIEGESAFLTWSQVTRMMLIWGPDCKADALEKCFGSWTPASFHCGGSQSWLHSRIIWILLYGTTDARAPSLILRSECLFYLYFVFYILFYFPACIF